jgi:hypothetical protein
MMMFYAELVETPVILSSTECQAHSKKFSAALKLPPETRAMLADHLLTSLDGPNQKAIDDAWAEEADRRWREI